MKKLAVLLLSLFALTAWSLPEAHDQANKTLVEVGNFCSGTIVDKTKGYVVTAGHCTWDLKKTKTVTTQRRDGVLWKYSYTYYNPVVVTQRKLDFHGDVVGIIKYRMSVYKVDAKTDVAILVNISSIPFDNEAKINTNPVSFGDKVYTIGNPLSLYGVVAEGTVFHPKLVLDVGLGGAIAWIGFDALIAPGSSGGGLFNDKGELIGLTNVMMRGTRLAFASPIINMVELLK